MPLKKSNAKMATVKIDEGNALRDDSIMSLFAPAKIPLLTLNTEQFAWPKTFLVVEPATRKPIYVKNPKTGWDLKDDNDKRTETGKFCVHVKLANGDIAQTLVDQGISLEGLTAVDCIIDDDIPVQTFEPQSTLLKLVKPTVTLGFGGFTVDRIIIHAEGVELV